MQRRILIIDDDHNLATSLEEVFSHVGHEVKVVDRRSSALAIENLRTFDLIITDLEVEGMAWDVRFNRNTTNCLPTTLAGHAGEHIKAFKICASNFRRDEFDEDELKDLLATVLDYKIRYIDTKKYVQDLHESIEFELPSALSLMHIVLEYLVKRVEKLGVVNSEHSNLVVALNEAFVNAIKHGNKFDVSKLVRIAAEVSKKEARFTVEDEGDGFDVDNIPDPCDPQNLFKSSGRGVLFIYNIMDEVKYNDRGNRVTMVKKAHEKQGQKE